MRVGRLLGTVLMMCISAAGNDFSFTASGTLPHLEFFQQRVIDNADSATSFAITFDNATVLTAIRLHDPLLMDAEFMIQRSHLLHCLVGWRADCMAAKRRVHELTVDHFIRFKEDISPVKLALALADDAQSRSMESSPRPMACNSILVGARRERGAAIYKVDVTGNFWKCQATAIGKLSATVEDWIRSKGIDLVAKKLESMKLEDGSGNSSSIPDYSGNDDTRFCMELTWQCLQDVVGGNLPQYCIEIATSRDGVVRG